MSAAPHDPLGPFTVEDWLRLDPRPGGSRIELIFGKFCVSPPPAMHHQYVGDVLRTVLTNALRRAGRTDLHAVTAIGVELSTEQRNAFVPGIAVIDTKPVGGSLRPENPLLAVEIWSPGNRRREREDKRLATPKRACPTSGRCTRTESRKRRPLSPTVWSAADTSRTPRPIREPA
ncbi:Putative restriction endonuclease [Streptoalloteichus hindustanus]|uniref:Putative restriction endonuclease n=1 Tax=Streptoalloteichus hindustanus TaxID=2017 RepID=A0A1M5GH37_STRHI|nr:Putative restriction endonuclease [Streptoalloteichus hindustanus]